MEVDRTARITEIDKGIKNRWNWKWMEEKDSNGVFLSDYVRKINKPGYARCIICHCDIRYGAGGKGDLMSHSKKKKHIENVKIKKTNSVLPSMFVSTKSDTSTRSRPTNADGKIKFKFIRQSWAFMPHFRESDQCKNCY